MVKFRIRHFPSFPVLLTLIYGSFISNNAILHKIQLNLHLTFFGTSQRENMSLSPLSMKYSLRYFLTGS